MSQEQPRRPQPEPIKYGDILPVSGELASKPVAMKDAAALQSAETRVLGETQKGGAAAIMHSAATLNENCGAAVQRDQMTDVVRDRCVDVKENVGADGTPIVTEEVGGEVVAQYAHPGKGKINTAAELSPEVPAAITIGQALEAAALSAGNKPVDESDAAAIQAAEVRATGVEHIAAGGLAAQARSAAAHNAKTMSDEHKIKLSDILKDVSRRLQGDKAVTRQDAERVIGAEMRNKESVSTYPGGVGEAMAEAARFNQLNLQTQMG